MINVDHGLYHDPYKEEFKELLVYVDVDEEEAVEEYEDYGEK